MRSDAPLDQRSEDDLPALPIEYCLRSRIETTHDTWRHSERPPSLSTRPYNTRRAHSRDRPEANHIINVADVAGDPAKLAISPQVLGARVFPDQAQRHFPIDHSDDCELVWHGDKTLTFGVDKQRLLLQILFAAYWTGSPILRVAAMLEEAGYGGQVNSLKKAFGRREDWRAFIKFDDGNC